MWTRRAPAEGPPSDGTVGGVVSNVKLRVADQAETLPAASCACARQWSAPPARLLGVQLPVAPVARPVAEDPLATTLLQPLSAQIWTFRLPLSPASLLANVALSVGLAARAVPSAGLTRTGTPGAFVSSAKLCVAVDAPWLPATSRPLSRQ